MLAQIAHLEFVGRCNIFEDFLGVISRHRKILSRRLGVHGEEEKYWGDCAIKTNFCRYKKITSKILNMRKLNRILPLALALSVCGAAPSVAKSTGETAVYNLSAMCRLPASTLRPNALNASLNRAFSMVAIWQNGTPSLSTVRRV